MSLGIHKDLKFIKRAHYDTCILLTHTLTQKPLSVAMSFNILVGTPMLYINLFIVCQFDAEELKKK